MKTQLLKIAGYWRVMRNRRIQSTHKTKKQAWAALRPGRTSREK